MRYCVPRPAFRTIHSHRFAPCTMLALSAMSSGCGSGSGYSGDDGSNAGSDDDSAGTPIVLEPTFASIQANVFSLKCIECHTGAAAPQGLRLDEANSYGLLVGVPSAEQPAALRVAPGDPDASYLIHKLEGTAAVGGRMPLDRPPLPQAEIDIIRQWILEGALPAAPPMPPTAPVRITSLSPLPEETLAQMPASIIVMFDRELDATSVDPTTFVLERSGGDGTFDDGNEVAVSGAGVAVPAENPAAAVLDLSGVAPVEDTYRVRLIGAGGATIRDLDANALDGEFDGTFPSGDGTGGGDFLAQFVVDGIQPTLASIQAHVLTPICSTCHSGPAQQAALPAGMDLTSAQASFANLVGVPSVQEPTLQRVTPGDPDASYLVHKLEGTAAQGGQMPLGLPPLDAATIAAIRQWIVAEAPAAVP